MWIRRISNCYVYSLRLGKLILNYKIILQIWSFKSYHLCPLFAPKWKKMYSTQNNNREALQIHSYKLIKYWNLCKCALLWIHTYVRPCQRNWLLNTFNRINLGTDWGVHRVHPPRGAGGHWRQTQGRRPNTPGKKQWAAGADHAVTDLVYLPDGWVRRKEVGYRDSHTTMYTIFIWLCSEIELKRFIKNKNTK